MKMLADAIVNGELEGTMGHTSIVYFLLLLACYQEGLIEKNEPPTKYLNRFKLLTSLPNEWRNISLKKLKLKKKQLFLFQDGLRMLSCCIFCVQHPNAGQNIQHLLIKWYFSTTFYLLKKNRLELHSCFVVVNK